MKKANDKKIKSIKHLIIENLTLLVGIPLTIFGFIELVNYIFDLTILQGSSFKGAAYLIVLSLMTFSIKFLLQLNFRNMKIISQGKRELNKMEAENVDLQIKLQNIDGNANMGLYESIKNAFNEKNWKEVIHLGTGLSRYLWIAGLYNLRLDIGKMVEEAAAHCGDTKTQALALIDDLGWTLIVCKRIEEGEKNIKHGLKIAQENNYPEIEYKAFRHLCGIYMDNRNFDKAEEYLEKAEKAISKIDVALKEQYSTQLQYTKASLFFKQRKFDKAIDECQKAKQKLEQGDKYREVKTYNLLGRIYMENNNTDDAIDIYRQGIEQCKECGRKDQLIRNYCGLMHVYKVIGEEDARKKIYDEALIVAQGLKNDKFINEVIDEYKR